MRIDLAVLDQRMCGIANGKLAREIERQSRRFPGRDRLQKAAQLQPEGGELFVLGEHGHAGELPERLVTASGEQGKQVFLLVLVMQCRREIKIAQDRRCRIPSLLVGTMTRKVLGQLERKSGIVPHPVMTGQQQCDRIIKGSGRFGKKLVGHDGISGSKSHYTRAPDSGINRSKPDYCHTSRTGTRFFLLAE